MKEEKTSLMEETNNFVKTNNNLSIFQSSSKNFVFCSKISSAKCPEIVRNRPVKTRLYSPYIN